jgi:hypothetical protein
LVFFLIFYYGLDRKKALSRSALLPPTEKRIDPSQLQLTLRHRTKKSIVKIIAVNGSNLVCNEKTNKF